jgi:Fe2+ transport system protein FeoA
MHQRTDGRRMTTAGVAPGAPAHERCVSLADLAPGTRARICSHPPTAPVAQRLEEFGLVPGTVLEVVRQAPLGDPVELDLRGYRLCLRRAELSALCAVLDDTVG